MDKKLREDNISIAKWLGYTYIPWNTQTDLEPGWQIEGVCESLRQSFYLCRHHIDLNFHSNISRSELILSNLDRHGYKYTINNNKYLQGFICISLEKPHKEPVDIFGKSIPEVVFKGVLEVIKLHYK